MSAKIMIPGPLRNFTDQQKIVQISAPTIYLLLQELVARFPKLKEHLFDEHERLQRFVNVFVNEEDIRFLADEKTEIAPGDTIDLVPAISGG